MSLSYNGTEPRGITYNGADVQSITYNGVEVWSADKSVGICLVQMGGGSGTWQRIDGNGNAVSGINFNDTYPWSGIHDETVDGQAMVYIPKFYIKTGTFDSGTYSGKKYWLVSEKPKTGYRIHPAFVRNGIEKDGFYIGKYFAYKERANTPGSASGMALYDVKTYNNAVKVCKYRNDGSSTGAKAGWHLWNVYELSVIQLLFLVEFGSPDAQTLVASGTKAKSGESAAKWRGICDLWGGWYSVLDGLQVNNNVIRIFSNNNDDTYVDTTATYAGDGWITDVYNSPGSDFNLGDVFIPSGITSSSSNGTFGDYNSQQNSSGTIFWVLGSSDDNHGFSLDRGKLGLFFYLRTQATRDFYSDMTCRLAKYDI